MLPANISFAAGCREPQCQQYSREEVVGVAGAADVVVVCLGTGRWDRQGTGWTWPGEGERPRAWAAPGEEWVPIGPLRWLVPLYHICLQCPGWGVRGCPLAVPMQGRM